MRYFIKIILLVLLMGTTLFSKDIGVVTAYNGKAYVQRAQENIELKLGFKLQEKDTIVTEKNSKVQVIFNDETIVTIGKDSKFSINEYLFEENQEPKLKFGLMQGAMRTITGKIGKIAPQKFEVRIKTATIGIRGTNFTIVQREELGTVYCTYGAISVTVNEYENIVKQGFYASVLDGKTEVMAFSADELKSLQKANFGDKKASKSVNEDKNVIEAISKGAQETQLDTTKEIMRLNVTTKRLSNKVQDAKQTSDDEYNPFDNAEEHNHYDYYVPDQGDYQEPINIVEKDPVPDVSNDVALSNISGSSVVMDKSLSPSNLNLSLDFASQQINDSKMSLYLTSSNGNHELWYLSIKYPTSIESIDKYTTEFSAVSISTGADSLSSSNPRIVSSSFRATNDDLVEDDAMTWGAWEASLLYDNDKGKDQATDISGLWVAGDKSDISAVDALSSGKVYYNGIYKAFDYTANNSLITGKAAMEVDFGADSALLNINYAEGREFDMSIYSNGDITGYQSNGEYGYSNANFYGPKANLIGGNFSTTTGGYDSLELKGVYELQGTISVGLTSTPQSTTPRYGWLVEYGGVGYSDTIEYQVLEDQTFVNSYIILNNVVSSTGEVDFWDFKIAKQPIKYTSNEQFETTLASAYMMPSTGGTSTNAELIRSSLVATGDDLADGDYMSWGYWNADVSYDNEEGPQKNSLSGFWQTGERTPASVLEAITSDNVAYSGIYRAVDFSTQNNDIVNGEASMNVNFGADTATLTLNYEKSRVFDMTISGGLLSGSSRVNEGEAYGTFYGPDANSIGGNFTTKTSSATNELKGVYQVSK